MTLATPSTSAAAATTPMLIRSSVRRLNRRGTGTAWWMKAKKETGPGFRLTRSVLQLRGTNYWQAGSPSPAVVTVGLVVLTPIPQTVPVSCVWLFVAIHAPAKVVIVGAFTPDDCLKFKAVRLVVYLAESEKNDSSELTRLRRSDFMAVTYAFDLDRESVV